MSKVGERGWLITGSRLRPSTVVITILWTRGLGAIDLHHLAFSSTETRAFRGEPEAQTNGSELIATLNDTFSNFVWNVTLPGLC